MSTPAVVQSLKVDGDGSGNNVGSFASLPAVGNYVCAIISTIGAAASPTCVDNQASQSYTKAIGQNGANSGSVLIWYAKVLTSGGTFTVSAGGAGSSNSEMVLMELSNVDPTTPMLVTPDFAAVTGFTATLATSGALAPDRINAFMVTGLITGATGHTFTPRGVLSLIQEQTGLGGGTGDILHVSGGALDRHGTDVVAPVGINSVDAVAQATVIFRGTDPQVTGPGGGAADDRYRFRPSTFWSGTSTLGQKRSAWPDDARDGGQRDSVADNFSRMN